MKKILVEIGMEFLNLIFGNIRTKTGLSLMLLIVGLVFIVVPMGNQMRRPNWFYIVGGLLILVSLLLIVKRYFELNRKSKDQTENVA